MKTTLSCLILTLAAVPALAQRNIPFRAEVRGSGNSGKCTIEVDVDGTAEITIRGDQGRMQTRDGQPARWVRFQCSAPFPQRMQDFRFRGIDGRGRQTLIRDPRQNNGAAVIAIEDPKSGSEGYTFDIEWSGGGGGGFPGGGYPGGPGGGGNDGREAIRYCRDAARDRAERHYNLRDVDIRDIRVDNNSGGRDYVSGNLEGRRSGRTERYDFSCEVNLSNGNVRSVNLRRR
jgi:hypothetical protein